MLRKLRIALVVVVLMADASQAQAQSAAPTYCWGGWTADAGNGRGDIAFIMIFMWALLIPLW